MIRILALNRLRKVEQLSLPKKRIHHRHFTVDLKTVTYTTPSSFGAAIITKILYIADGCFIEFKIYYFILYLFYSILHGFLKLHFFLFPFLTQIFPITLSLFIYRYKNLFVLFSRKADKCRAWKINAYYILSSSAKSC